MKKSMTGSLGWVLALSLLLSANSVSGLIAAAQDLPKSEQLSGRLGGVVADMQTRFGEPDWTDTGLIGYNSVVLNGVDTILVVYFDEADVVTKLSLVYLEQPAAFTDPRAIADSVAAVGPQDATCETTPLATSSFGSEVYGCTSKALADGTAPLVSVLPGLTEESGSYSYSVDPIAGEYYEVIVQMGTGTTIPVSAAISTTVPSPTLVPTAAPTEAAQIAEPSGGLGLSQTAWEAEHGPGDDVGLMSYENQTYLVMFIQDRVYNLSVNLGVPVNTLDAAAIALTYIPDDSVYVGSGYDDFGNPLDYYQSAWLAEVLPVTADFDPYLGAPPGTLFTLYSLDSDGSVDSLLIAASASP